MTTKNPKDTPEKQSSAASSPKTASPKSSETEIDPSIQPEFIYGGPFIPHKSEKTFFLDSVTAFNSPLQGTFKQSFAYRTLKERMPIILTKVIDLMSKKGEPKETINEVAKMKNELVTNKMYTPLKGDSEDAVKWNDWIYATPCHYYFNNSFLFTECYIYRRLRDIIETGNGNKELDPFEAQKDSAFNDMIEASCVAAEELQRMLSAEDPIKPMFALLLKMSLWSNKCDLSLSGGSAIHLGEKSESGEKYLMDPVRWVENFKTNVLIDNSKKVKLEFKVKKKINPNSKKLACKCAVLAKKNRLPVYLPEGAKKKREKKKKKKGEEPPPPPPPAEGAEPAPPPPDKIPCPVRITTAQTLFFDIVCDNAGFEMVMDLIVGDFLIQKNIVNKVRYHVKSIPWFVSDVTPKDFRKVVQMCADANYFRTAPQEPIKPKPKRKSKTALPPEPPPELPPRDVSSQALQAAAQRWQQYLDDGTFILMTDTFWTSPHPFKEMKKYAPPLYRKLQYSQTILFKGDLNYRKLLGDIRVNPKMSFLNALQGFNPAPILAVRTIKCDIISNAPKPKGKGKKKVDKVANLDKKDPYWMETGDIGVIQYTKKKEKMKPSDQPCPDYGTTCIGLTCPTRVDLY